MLPFIVLIAAFAGKSDDPCRVARADYEALALAAAVSKADAELAQNPARPLECLEVRVLALTVLGRFEEAEATLRELFEREPDYDLRDPSLSPAIAQRFDVVREEVRPLALDVTAKWMAHDSLRLDGILGGGLRGARRIRFKVRMWPSEETLRSEVAILGRAATATVAVSPHSDARVLRAEGVVVDDVGLVIHRFSSELLLPERPSAREAEKIFVESETIPWTMWAGLGVGVAAATAVIVILAQPNLPDATGTIGRVGIDR